MKIAQVVSTFPPYKAGIGNAAYHLSWELSQLGNRVTVFTVWSRGGLAIDQSLPFTVRRMRPLLYYGNAGFVPQLLWELRNFDIVHLHYPFFGGAEMLYVRDLVKHLNIILHYHMDVVGEGMLKRLFAFHTARVLPGILDHANKIIVTSMNYLLTSQIKDYYDAHRDKFVAIPLGVNPQVFKPGIKNKDLLDKHHLHNKKVVLFVGALDRAHYFKGVNYLIKAFQLIASNDEYRLLIVGGGPMKTGYESLVTNYGLERKVVFAGEVSDDWLPIYYNVGDVFALPSVDRSEAFGLTILEAMATGLPVIASDLPGLRSVVHKDVTGLLFKPRQITVLAKYMRHLLENPQIGNRYGEQGRLQVLEHYTWEVVGKAVNSLYREHR